MSAEHFLDRLWIGVHRGYNYNADTRGLFLEFLFLAPDILLHVGTFIYTIVFFNDIHWTLYTFIQIVLFSLYIYYLLFLHWSHGVLYAYDRAIALR